MKSVQTKPAYNVKSLLEDGIDGSLSSRRVITFIAMLLCSTAFIANLFFHYKMDDFIFNSMTYIVLGGLGSTVAEKFAPAITPPPK
jgi:hypothetical protein